MVVKLKLRKKFLYFLVLINLTIFALGKPTWKLGEGILAKYYKNPNSIIDQRLKLDLRLEHLFTESGEIYFYDHKGNILALDASLIFYNRKLLTYFRNLPKSVSFRVEFIGKGLDLHGRLTGKLLNLERLILPNL